MGDVDDPHITTIETRNHFSRFSSNSEAFTSQLPENLEEIIHRYYMHCNMLGMFKSPAKQ